MKLCEIYQYFLIIKMNVVVAQHVILFVHNGQ